MKSGEASASGDVSTRDVSANGALKFIRLGDGHYKLVAAQSANNPAFVSDLEVGSDGLLTFDGLGEGDYVVREVTRPAGYSDTFMPTFKVHVQADATDAAKSSYTNESDTWNLVAPHATPVSSDKAIVVLAITSISQLPLTGGAGILLALLVIALLAVATGLLIVTRRRLRQE